MSQDKIPNPPSSFIPETDLDEELTPEALRKKATEHARKLKELKDRTFEGHPPADPGFIKDLLKAKIPGLTGLLQGVGRTGGTISSLIAATGHVSQPLQAAGSGFHIAGAALAAVDFVRIPLVSLAAFIAGEKPITLSKTGRWLYSATGLGLALTAILVPVAAPYIGVAAAGIALGVSVITLGNMIYQRQKLKKSLKQTETSIEAGMTELKDIASEAERLENELGTLDATRDAKRISQIESSLTTLGDEAKSREEALQTLYDKQATDNAKLKKMGFTAFMDKGVAIGLGSMVVIGAIVSLFFPVAGLSILAAAGVIGVSYAAGRFLGPMVAPYVKKFGSWVASNFTQDKDDSREPAPELIDANSEKAALTDHDALDKNDAGLIEHPRPRLSLLGGKSKDELEKLTQQLQIETERMDAMNNKLTSLVEKNDARGVLNFFSQLKQNLKAECPHEDLSCVSDLFESIKPALKLLGQAVKQIRDGELKLSEKEQIDLENAVDFTSSLLEKPEAAMMLTIANEHHVKDSLQKPSAIQDDEDDKEGEGMKEDDTKSNQFT
ncbi:hypothetical protein GH742_01490 [Legionella sp. MW5194]|uniref:hypothetical protein n=1 Tax=Legionella sp. MW5194 TaxID=2662448 RepID=UPI00193EA8F8|nr:hypothetical protein [Legionella sp. MW5194]QRN02653.1 hypothetical protein GH742_01490 [Legionella sp. MW5194]